MTDDREPGHPEPDHADPAGLPPRARAVQGRRAGPVTRGLANLIDSALVILLLVISGVSLSLVGAALDLDTGVSALGLIGLSGSVAWVYLAVAWVTVGSTYGQGLMGIRVVSRRGTRLRPLRGVARATLCVFFPWLWFWILVSPRAQTPFDLAVGSQVVYDWKHRRG